MADETPASTATETQRCYQCGRVGTLGFEALPFLDGMDPIIICASRSACRKRWPKPLSFGDDA